MKLRLLLERIFSDAIRYREIQGAPIEQPWQTVLGCVILGAAFFIIWIFS